MTRQSKDDIAKVLAGLQELDEVEVTTTYDVSDTHKMAHRHVGAYLGNRIEDFSGETIIVVGDDDYILMNDGRLRLNEGYYGRKTRSLKLSWIASLRITKNASQIKQEMKEVLI